MFKFFGFETPLCNSRYSTFVLKDVSYNSMDQYITAMKAKLFHDEDAYKAAMNTEQPIHVKRIPVHGYDEVVWVQKAEKILYKGLKEKFKQNPGYRKYLIKTGDNQMVYCDPKDKIYGTGTTIWDPNSTSPDKWPGKNLLGKNLEKIRTEFLTDPAYKEEIIEILDEILGLEPPPPPVKKPEPKTEETTKPAKKPEPKTEETTKPAKKATILEGKDILKKKKTMKSIVKAKKQKHDVFAM